MNAEIAILPEHMRQFGLYGLGKALYDATFSEYMRPYAHAIAVSSCANAAEVLIKARIAEVHPLLIFTKLPRLEINADFEEEHLALDRLLDEGRTYMYADLPQILWATTGYRIGDMALYNHFGKIRNRVTHLSHKSGENLSDLILRFIMVVMQPIAWAFWEAKIADFAAEYDDEIEEYLPSRLVAAGIANVADCSRLGPAF